MGWQEAWELYQDTHTDADWYDFEQEYWGDDEEDDEELSEYEDSDEELSEDDIDDIHDAWHPNETQDEFAEHEDLDD